ncbi:unnamed protein product [marine sediment metagenome]|uniref:Uncharacterized protein n=1 Tax=marine sediment metagenome TaxID=412755 RepID=X1JWX8_9ZZZZ
MKDFYERREGQGKKKGEEIGPKFTQEFDDFPNLREVKFCKPKKENQAPDREPKKLRLQKGLDKLYGDYYYRHAIAFFELTLTFPKLNF